MDYTTKDAGRYMADIKSTTATTKAPNGSFEAILSVPTVDRDKEVLDPAAFSPLPEHITIDIDHAMSVEKTIGSGRPFYDGPVLKFAGTYASHPLAQMVRSLVEEGHIRTMSVAYMNAHYEIDDNDGLAHLRKAELLNAGIVGIPSNREALITASKSLASAVAAVSEVAAEAAEPAPVEKAGARHSAKDVERIQSAHDALAELGAICAGKAHAPDAAKAAEEPTTTTPEDTAAAAKAAAAVPPAHVDVTPTTDALALAAEATLLLT
jgi:HK97 family phage prohead protease